MKHRFACAGPSKLGMRVRGVNSTLLFGVCLLIACRPARPLPGVPPGQWSSLLGDAHRSAYVAEVVPERVEIAWRRTVGPGITAALQVHGDVVLATTTARAAVTLRAADGAQYWRSGFSATIAGSVLKQGHRVIVATGDRDRRIHALEITQGRRLWSRDAGAVRVEPVLVDDRIVLANEAGWVAAFAQADGLNLWRVQVGAAPAAAPVVWDGRVVVATLRDSLFLIDAEDGRIAGRTRLSAPPSAPGLIRADTLIQPLSDGTVAGIVLPSLAIAWRASLGTAPVLAAPVPLGEHAVALLTRDADVWRLDPGGRATRLARLGGGATGSLTAAANGLLVGRLDGTLFMLSHAGSVVWQTRFGASIVAPVAIASGSVYVALLSGDVVRLR